MFKNVIKYAAPAAIAMSLALAGTPAIASANNGLHLQTNMKADENAKHESANFNFESREIFGLEHLNLDLEGTTSGSTQTAFHQAVKDANTNFKNAKKNAKTQLKASVNAATNQVDRKAAVKTYLTNILAAFKARSAAIEAAFQTFINANF